MWVEITFYPLGEMWKWRCVIPRLYANRTDFLNSVVGTVYASQITQIPANTVDAMLFTASQNCDNFTKRRLGAPQSTTLSAQANPGDMSVQVASTIGWDSGAEQAIILDTGNAQEIIPIVPGGVTANMPYISPYPGTINLASPVANTHASGTTVQGCYQEVSTAGSSSSKEPYTEDLLTQEAEVAQAHAPLIGQGGNLTRKVFLNSYPLITLYKVEHAFPWINTYAPIDVSAVLLNSRLGTYKLNLGTVVIPEGNIRTTYTGGFQNVPDNVKQAAIYYVADQLAVFYNIAGVLESQMGKRRLRFSTGVSKSLWIQKAEDELCRLRKIR